MDFTPGAPFTDMDLFPAWISNHMSSKMLGISNHMHIKAWGEITNPFPNFNGFNNLSMLEFKLNHVSKRVPMFAPDCVFLCGQVILQFRHWSTVTLGQSCDHTNKNTSNSITLLQ